MRLLKAGDIEFELVRKRVKRVNLRVRKDGTVMVSAPHRVGAKEILSFVLAHQAWIKEMQDRRNYANACENSRWCENGTIHLFGQPLALCVIRDAKNRVTSGCTRKGDELEVHLSRRITPEHEQAEIKRLALAWLSERLARELPAIFENYQHQMGVSCSGWSLKRMASRWGSCNVRTKAIVINSILAERPHICLESVVAHELCHLLEPSHNARFHALLDQYCPSNRVAQDILNKMPPIK